MTAHSDETMHVWRYAEGRTVEAGTAPVPTPGADEVAVAPSAWGLNNGDLRAEPGGIAGFEFAGTISAVGEGVDPALVGTRVMGLTGGAFADVVVAHRRHVVAIPEGLTDEAAASLTTAVMTEQGALNAADVKEGDTVLITGATSGIGLMGIRLAKLRGAALVIATTRSEERKGILLDAGADLAVAGDYVDEVLEATGGEGVDIVLDHVGGEALGRAVDAARSGGLVLSVGRLAGDEGVVNLMTLARRHVTLRSVSYGFSDPEIIGEILDTLSDRVLPAFADGTLTPAIDSVHSFADAPGAFARLASGDGAGKVVLTR